LTTRAYRTWSAAVVLADLLLVFAAAPFVLLLAGGFMLSLNGDEVYEVTPSPDRALSLVIIDDLAGWGWREDVHLAAGSFDELADVGGYTHGGWRAGDGWRGPRTINVCMLRYDLTPPDQRLSEVDIASPGEAAARVTIERGCP
jgi:hypothetical protein